VTQEPRPESEPSAAQFSVSPVGEGVMVGAVGMWWDDAEPSFTFLDV